MRMLTALVTCGRFRLGARFVYVEEVEGGEVTQLNRVEYLVLCPIRSHTFNENFGI